MGRACGTYRIEGKCIHDFGEENCSEKQLGRSRRRWKLISKWIFEK
jgi:hypothetical protein